MSLIQHEISEQNLPTVEAETVDLVTESDFRLGGELANFIQNLMSSEG